MHARVLRLGILPVGFLLVGWLLGFSGCLWQGTGPGAVSDSPIAAGKSAPQPVRVSQAEVQFVLLPPPGRAAANILAQTTTVPEVTFELQVINPGNAANPASVLTKRVTAVASGGVGVFAASVTFPGIPSKPVIGRVTIGSGTLNGFSLYHGARELVPGSNTIVLAASGTAQFPDLLGRTALRLLGDATQMARFPFNTVAQIEGAFAQAGIRNGSTSETAWQAVTGFPGFSFALPTGFSSVAFPAGGNALTLADWASGRGATFVLVNGSDTPADVSLSAGTILGRIAPALTPEEPAESPPLTPAQQWHLALRRFGARLHLPSPAGPAVRPMGRVLPDVAGQAVAFKIPTADGNGIANTINAVCKRAEVIDGTKAVNLYVDTADAANWTTTFEEDIVQTWTGIYFTNREIFGEEPAVSLFPALTSDDITILCSSQISDLGFFWAGDLYPPALFPASNQRKMFYLQYKPTDAAWRDFDFKATMAHEFQHMINARQRFQATGSLPETEIWLDESMSGYAEIINGFGLDQGNYNKTVQIRDFLQSVHQTSLTSWSGGNADYGKAILFGTWLAETYGTNGAVTALLQSPALATAAVEAFTNRPFGEVLARWGLAMFVNDTAGGTYGYSNLNLRHTYSFGDSLGDVTLTGPGVILGGIPYSSFFSLGGSTIRYVKLIPTAAGNVLLTLPAGLSCYHLW